MHLLFVAEALIAQIWGGKSRQGGEWIFGEVLVEYRMDPRRHQIPESSERGSSGRAAESTN